jgi:modulator of drug activity B
MSKHVHIVNAHQHYPGISEGRLNRTLAQITKSFCDAAAISWTETIIEQGYSVEQEVALYLKADYVIIHAPVYWFNTPWPHKKYTDEVFNEALNSGALLNGDGRTRSDPSKHYGTGGLSQGKKMTLVATWNAPEAFSGDKDQYLLQGKTADDVLYNVGINYRFCGYEILPFFHCFDVVKAPDVTGFVNEYQHHLANIIQ